MRVQQERAEETTHGRDRRESDGYEAALYGCWCVIAGGEGRGRGRQAAWRVAVAVTCGRGSGSGSGTVEVEVGSELKTKTREHYLARWADYTEMDMRAAGDSLSGILTGQDDVESFRSE